MGVDVSSAGKRITNTAMASMANIAVKQSKAIVSSVPTVISVHIVAGLFSSIHLSRGGSLVLSKKI
jgi:hypothetical protein